MSLKVMHELDVFPNVFHSKKLFLFVTKKMHGFVEDAEYW